MQSEFWNIQDKWREMSMVTSVREKVRRNHRPKQKKMEWLPIFLHHNYYRTVMLPRLPRGCTVLGKTVVERNKCRWQGETSHFLIVIELYLAPWRLLSHFLLIVVITFFSFCREKKRQRERKSNVQSWLLFAWQRQRCHHCQEYFHPPPSLLPFLVSYSV